MTPSQTTFAAKVTLLLLRISMVIAGLLLILSWDRSFVTAATGNDSHVVCGEACASPSDFDFTLFLPEIDSVAQPVSPHIVVQPEAKWTADWWGFIERMANGPVLEQGDVDCSRGQSGSLWFLAGANDNLPKTRNCTIPTGKTLLAPLFTIVFYNDIGEDYSLEEKIEHLDGFFNDEEPGLANTELCRLESSIDGTPVNSVRLLSPPFPALGDPEAISDGYWLAFQLSPGVHQVKFAGVLCEFETDIETYVVDITYNLTVTE